MIAKGSRIAAGVILLLCIAAGTLAARLPRAGMAMAWLIDRANALPAAHWLAFSAVQVVVAMCGFLPASLMAVAAGAAYGMIDGFLLSAASTILGGWLAFLLSRSMLRPWIERWTGGHDLPARYDEAIGREGWRFVCLLRVSPIMPFAATSYGLGLTRIGQGAYLLGTLASLPALAAYVSLGAFGSNGVALARAQAGPWQWAVPILGLATILVAVARLKRVIGRAGVNP